MRSFSKLLVDNLRIVSDLYFNWFLTCFFLNLLLQGTCFASSSFYRFTVEPLPVKALKSPVNRNWNSAYILSLFDQWKYRWMSCCSLSFPIFRFYRYFHSSRFWQLLCLCRHFIIAELPWNLFSSGAFYGFAGVIGFPFSFAYRQFVASHIERESASCYSGFRSSLCVRVLNFLHSD
jgi:hypothetical protein